MCVEKLSEKILCHGFVQGQGNAFNCRFSGEITDGRATLRTVLVWFSIGFTGNGFPAKKQGFILPNMPMKILLLFYYPGVQLWPVNGQG